MVCITLSIAHEASVSKDTILVDVLEVLILPILLLRATVPRLLKILLHQPILFEVQLLLLLGINTLCLAPILHFGIIVDVFQESFGRFGIVDYLQGGWLGVQLVTALELACFSYAFGV